MKKLATVFAAGLFLCCLDVTSGRAQTFYIASNGSDSNDGLSTSTPWRTIDKVNSMMASFNPGAQILFKRGDTFYGKISATRSGTPGNEIVFGSYGTGALPVIKGTKVLTGWTVYSGNIYSVNISDTISHIYANGKLMTLARFPNSRFLKCDFANSKVAFDDAELTQPSGYWNGVNCRVRTGNWCYESRTVSTYTVGHVNFSSPTVNNVIAKAGYFFDNRLNLLDTANEWFYDKGIGKLYFFAPGGVNPNTMIVEAVVTKYGFQLNLSQNNVILQDLEFNAFRDNCVEIYTATNIRVQRCVIRNAGKNGMRLNGTNHIVNNNVFEDNLNTSLTGVFTNGTVTNNTIRRTALIPGFAENAWGGQAIQFYTSTGTICRNNIIDSTGYTGLLVSKNMLVEKNFINHSCLTLNDGAGIEINDADGMQILDNIVINSVGSVESSYSPNRYAMGIYFANTITKNILIRGNTLANNGYAGINVDNKPTSENVQILDNVLYNNAYTQLVMTDHSSSGYVPSFTNTVRGNIMYALSAQSTCMEHQMFRSPNWSDYGNFDSNYYCNPYTEHFLRRSMVYGTYSTKYYTLSGWQQQFNEDMTSGKGSFAFDQYRVLDTLSGNMISNPRFTSNTTGWTTTPASGSFLSHRISQVLDTGCMKISWNGNGGVESMTSSNYLTLTKNYYYQLSFNYTGDRVGDFSNFGRPNAGSSPFLFPRRYFETDLTKKAFSFVFKPDTTETFARVTFALSLPDTSLYVDNVYLHRVTAERIDSTQKNKLFYNPTNITQVVSLGGLPYHDIYGSSVSGSITLPPYSSKILIHESDIIPKRLTLSVLTEGMYNHVSGTSAEDTVRVYLRNPSAPYAIMDSAKAVVNNAGIGEFSFANALNGFSYYIAVIHRNSIETWSSNPVAFSSGESTYDFTSSSASAYGNNLTLQGNRYCIYSGDINSDRTIDATDASAVANDAAEYVTGYVPTDLTGEGFVDATDFSIADNNANNYVLTIRP